MTEASNSEKLLIVEQKAKCDMEFASKGYMKVVFYVLMFFFTLIVGGYGYTKIIGDDVREVDRSVIINTERYNQIQKSLESIDKKLEQLPTPDNTRRRSND